MRNVVWSRLIRPFKLYWLTAGLVVQVVGPDIKDKVEILNEAKKYFNGCFEVRIKEQWFAGQNTGKSPHPGPLLHGWRILAQSTHLTWRYYARDRFMPKSVIQFVLYDGGLASVALEPARYGFRSAAGLSLLQRFVPRPIEIVLLPESLAQMCQPSEAERDSSSASQLETWCAWAYNGRERNVVITADSAEESGRRLAISILQEMEVRFGVPQCRKLQRMKAEYSQEKRVLR
jgi:hypothetical protein